MAEQWLSIVEYARTYQVSDMTVRRHIKTGKLHAVLKEGKYFIPVRAGSESQQGRESHAERRQDDRVTRPPQPEIQVIKAHPAAQRTLTPPSPAGHQPAPPPLVPPQHSVTQPSIQPHYALSQQHRPPAAFGDEHPETQIPSSLRRPLAAHDTSLVDTRALLAFCEASMRKFNDLERRQVERFKSKLEALEATVARKDMEIQMLRQQVEDLQLLASTLERRMGERRS